MNMRKNILASLFAFGLVMMAVACGGNKKTEETKDGKLTYTPHVAEPRLNLSIISSYLSEAISIALRDAMHC